MTGVNPPAVLCGFLCAQESSGKAGTPVVLLCSARQDVKGKTADTDASQQSRRSPADASGSPPNLLTAGRSYSSHQVHSVEGPHPTSEPCTLASLPSGWSYWWDQPVLPGLEGALWLLMGTVGLGGFMFISLSAQQFSWACTGLVGAGVVGKP